MKKIILVVGVTFLICISGLVFSGSAFASVFDVWADSNGDDIKDLLLGSILGYDGTIGAKENYNYYSYSGHPINGPTPEADKFKIFIYELSLDSSDYLNIIAGVDGSGGNHRFRDTIDISGSTSDPKVVRHADDRRELRETSDNHFVGRWHFGNNTDGGVIGSLTGGWEARITPDPVNSNLAAYGFYSSDGSIISFDDLAYKNYYISAQVVPEPATMLLLGLGLAGLVRFRRKRV